MFIMFQDLNDQEKFIDFLKSHDLFDTFLEFFKGSKYIQFWNTYDSFKIEFAYEILRNYNLKNFSE